MKEFFGFRWINKFVCISIISITLFLSGPSVFGIDMKDWEGDLKLFLFGAKPEREWLLNVAFAVLRDAFPENIKSFEDKNYFEQFIKKDSDILTVPIASNWHDLTEFTASFSKKEDINGYLYITEYTFKEKTLTLLDILGRYGYKLAEIKTNTDLSKELNYVLKKDMPSLGIHPLWMMVPLKPGQITILTFKSKDKVFVDKLFVSTYCPDNKK